MVNPKKTYRLYKEERRDLRTKRRRKSVSRYLVPKVEVTEPGQLWSMDFVHDQLVDGRRLRLLTVEDTFTRASPALEVDTSLSGQRVAQVLERLRQSGQRPAILQVDNGPEFISKALDAWAYRHGVHLALSRRGKPTDNAFIESFKGKRRSECLNLHGFVSLVEAQMLVERWRVGYNEVRPHSVLGQLAAAEYTRSWTPRDLPEEVVV